MASNIAGVPSNIAILEALQKQTDSRGLDVLAYLIESETDQKDLDLNSSEIALLSNQLYGFLFYGINSKPFTVRLTEAVSLIEQHEPLRLRKSVLDGLVSELLLLLRLCILGGKDDFGSALPFIYACIPQEHDNYEELNRHDLQQRAAKLDVDEERNTVQDQLDKRLFIRLRREGGSLGVTREYLNALEVLLSGTSEALLNLFSERPLLPFLLMRVCFAFTYVSDQQMVLLSVRVIRRLRNLLHLSKNAETYTDRGSFDITVFRHLETLVASKDRIQSNAGYQIWVGLLSAEEHSLNLGPLVQSESYWDNLIGGLNEGTGEVKKICLHILWQTVQVLNQDLRLRSFNWKSSERASLLEFWKTYMAFTEMLALDNSVNQLRLASTELEALVARAKMLCIPGPWIVALLSQGFRSTSTNDMSLRLSELILNFHPDSLWWILLSDTPPTLSPLKFLKDSFFPQVFKTSNFDVSIISSRICEHGEAISTFVRSLVKSSLNDGTSFQSLLHVLLQAALYDNRQATAGQFYLLKGLTDGVEKHGRCLDFEHSDLILRIANTSTENLLRGDMKLVLSFKLLLHMAYPDGSAGQLLQISQISQIFRNRPQLLDIDRIKMIVDASKLDVANVQELSKLALETLFQRKEPKESDIGACALVAALCFYLRAPSIILQYPSSYTEGGAPSSNLQDTFDTILVSLLQFGLPYKEALRSDPKIHRSVTNTFREIFNQSTHTPHIQDISSLVPLLDDIEKFGVHQSAIGVLQDISENWTGGFSDIGSLLAVLRFNLRLCIESTKGTTVKECSDELLNAIVARTSSFCTEVYEKVNQKRGFHEIITYFLELTEIMLLSKPKLPLGLADYILTTLHVNVLPYTDGLGFSVLLNCFQHIFGSCPDVLQSSSNLGELLEEWAAKAEEERLGRDHSSNQALAIQIILHPIILDASVATGPSLVKICKDIQKCMAKRRGLSPALSRALCHAFDTTPDTFCREHGFTEILHEFLVPTGARFDDNNLAVEEALAALFDQISNCPGSYERYHGEREKIAQARIFDLLARFDYDDAIQELWAKTLLDEVFEEWTQIDPKDPATLKIVQKWKKTAQLQTVLLLERFVTEDDAEEHLETIFVALSREASPRYKFLLEWMAFRCILRFQNLRTTIWERFDDIEESIPGFVVSLLRLAHLVSRHLDENIKKEFFSELVNKVLPCATSNKVIIRHEGAELIPQLYEDAKEWGYHEILENPIFKSVYKFALRSPYRKVLVPSSSDPFDPVDDFTLTGVLSGSYIMSDEGGEIIPLFFAEDFLSFGADKTRRFVPVGSDSPASKVLDKSKKGDRPASSGEAPPNSTPAPIQTKGGDWDVRNLLEREDGSGGRFTARRQSHDLFVVASLVDNHVNLGGISRVCELSGVRELFMNNKTTALKAKEFTSVSVSSEQWLPITELKRPEITTLLASKRREGYSIVGIEQTDRSVILGSKDCVLPQKTVLVIGAEKTGIPPELLAEMDVCVEVKQFGETRSMNVQTVTAVVLYEYVRQHGDIQ